MNIRSTLAVTLLCFSVMGGCSPLAHAGFMLSDGQTSSQAPSTQKGITFESYEVDKGIDESAPALKVFNERYVPDSVRAKYKLQENWSNTPAVSSDPIDLSPEPLPEEGKTPEASKPTVIISQPSSPTQTVDTWRARKGESIRDVLRRWSDRQGVDLMWASPNTPSLQKDFSFVGKYQDAVGKLLKETGGEDLHSQFRSEGLDPVMMTPASTVTTNKPAPEVAPAAESKKDANVVSKIFEPIEPKAVPETRWFGLSGAPLGEVLKVWAEQEGIVLIWQAENNYALKESISQVGTFEDAVYKALSQYDADLLRPVGEIYMDEKSGQKVLVIRSDAP